MIMKNPQSSLPPGFRFHPTDEELILHYLRRKVTCSPLPVSIIAEVDIYKLNPWDLPAKAAFGEKEWYFFSPRDRKYPNGARPNRAAASGYWKATGTDKVIVASSASTSSFSASARQHPEKLGVKKALVFYKGRPPKGVKTNWIMHEYRLAESPAYNSRPSSNPSKLKDSSMRLDDWVLCRIYKKTNVSSPTTASVATPDQDQEEEEEEGLRYIHQNELKPLIDIPNNDVQSNGGLVSQKSSSFSNLLDALDYSMLSSFLSDNNPQLVNMPGFDQSTPLIPNNNDHVDMNDPNMFINGICNNESGNYFAQKLPQLSPSSSAPFIEENRLKRHRPMTMADTDPATNQAKRLHGHCSFTNKASQVTDFPQYNSINSYPFLNQQLLLGPNNHSHFHG